MLPIANRLPLRSQERETRFPLAVGYCSNCHLVQLMFELPADQIFDVDYPYYSSYSAALVEHSTAHVQNLVSSRGLNEEALFAEVASNDGYLLEAALRAGVRTVGIEPSPGPAAVAIAKGVATVEEFFGLNLARRLVQEHGHADVIVANNVMAHVPDVNDFVSGLAEFVSGSGLITVENPAVGAMLYHCAFDTVYHEHYSYFSTLSVKVLAERHGLRLVDVDELPLQGGSLRWHLAKDGDIRPAVHAQLDREERQGLHQRETYSSFSGRVSRLQDDLRAGLRDLQREGLRIAAYGAAAKGATMLGSSGIDRSLIEFVVDRNENKQGRYLPGTGIPIVPVERLLAERPDVVLLLAWNVADEVVREQEEYLNRGGRFYVPVPDFMKIAG